MPMSEYNRNNPFVIHMENSYHKISDNLIDFTKFIIVASIAIFISMVVACILFRNIFPIIFVIVSYAISYIVIKEFMKSHINLNYVKEIVNGPDYSVIQVNNEKIYKVICNLMRMEGALETLWIIAELIGLFVVIVSALLFIIGILIGG
jgi:hypothetical protein